MATSLRDLIESTVPLGRPSAKGWRPLRCALCNDHSERAAFLLEGDAVAFTCFNCGVKAKYEENAGELSKNMRRVLVAHGVRPEALTELSSAVWFQRGGRPGAILLEDLKPPPSLVTPEVSLPPGTRYLGSEGHEDLQAPLIEYLLRRGQDPLQLRAAYSLSPQHHRRVVLPCHRDGKVIYWQSRAIDDGVKPRYRSAGETKDAVLWGYDHLWRHPHRVLFVTEGIFNAAPVQGVALLGSKVSESQALALERCRRRKVVVVDRDSNGEGLAAEALRLGWELTFVDERASDVADSAARFGRAYTAWSLLANATSSLPDLKRVRRSEQAALSLGMQLAIARMRGEK
jgi:hypothetical protein